MSDDAEPLPFIPPGFKWPIGPPPSLANAPPPVVVPHASEPLMALPRNVARMLIGYESAVNVINEIHNTFTTGGTPVVGARFARNDPVNSD